MCCDAMRTLSVRPVGKSTHIKIAFERWIADELRLIEDLPIYTAVESIDYLQALDKTNRFDADSVGP